MSEKEVFLWNAFEDENRMVDWKAFGDFDINKILINIS